MPDPRISLARSGTIATIRIDRPDKLNAMTMSMFLALAEAFAAADADTGLRVVVLASAGGRAFSVGADISEFEAHRGSRAAALAYVATLHRATGALSACRHPVIAAIGGLCVGGGLEIAVNADLRIAATGSRFGLPIKRLGLPVDYSELAALRRLVGPAQALAMVLEGRIFDAAEAERIGLVTRLVPDAALDAAVQGAADAIASGAPLAARVHKRMIRRLDDPHPLSEAEREEPFALFDSEDYREGTRAFLEKRTPEFQGA
jgi:enoyl-CoA hydratase/carnithine racemase